MEIVTVNVCVWDNRRYAKHHPDWLYKLTDSNGEDIVNQEYILESVKGNGTAILESCLLLEGENEKSMAMKYYCQYGNEILYTDSTFENALLSLYDELQNKMSLTHWVLKYTL